MVEMDHYELLLPPKATYPPPSISIDPLLMLLIPLPIESIQRRHHRNDKAFETEFLALVVHFDLKPPPTLASTPTIANIDS
mmetsp:Transcript_10012/g.14609  ORF Transcript_10012/g.14609 Transcript_10012/m.14609 type:complete len:81 (+) Transcript_10012:237-479(+)